MTDSERVELIHELLYQARCKLGAAYAASERLQDTPGGVEGLWRLSKQVELAWWEYWQIVPDDEVQNVDKL